MDDPLLSAVHALDLPPNTRILAAVSGGPDSMVLLDTLLRAAPAHQWSVIAGHINHQLRGAESDEDEAFVRAQATAHGASVYVERVDPIEVARRLHLSPEAAAREVRYRALRAILERVGGDVIALGHTADDQVETLILRLLRGTGLTGLGGMETRRQDLIRPFLAVTRPEILAAADARSIPYRLDSSNDDQRFRRNAVRASVLPEFLRLQPRFREIAAREMQSFRIDADYLQSQARDLLPVMLIDAQPTVLSLSAPLLRAAHPSLRAAILALALDALRPPQQIDHRVLADLDALLAGNDRARTELWPGLAATLLGHALAIALGSTPPPFPGSATLTSVGVVDAALGTLHVSTSDADVAAVAVLGPYHALMAEQAVHWPITVRARLPGDRISPPGTGGSKKLQDVFVDRKIPAAERPWRAVIQDALGILWVPGVVRGDRLAASAGSELLLHLRFFPTRAR